MMLVHGSHRQTVGPGVTLSDLALRALRREVETLTFDEVVARVRELGPVYSAPPASESVREERDRR